MTDTLEQKLSRAVSDLTAVERENLLDYIAVMRGKALLGDLSAEDRQELQRRAETIDSATLVPISDVEVRIKTRLALRQE